MGLSSMIFDRDWSAIADGVLWMRSEKEEARTVAACASCPTIQISQQRCRPPENQLTRPRHAIQPHCDPAFVALVAVAGSAVIERGSPKTVEIMTQKRLPDFQGA